MSEIYLVDKDLPTLARWSAAFRGMSLDVSAAQTADPVHTARRLAALDPMAIVVGFTGGETVVDVRQHLEAAEGTPVLIMIPSLPPRAALSRITASHGAPLLDRGAAPIVVVSTVVAMLAHDETAVHG